VQFQHQHRSRRQFLQYSATAVAGAALLARARGVTEVAAQTPQASPVSLGDPTKRQGDYAEVNGARIFYQMSGQGQPMFLIHGYPLSGALFSRVRDALAAQYQVITIDQRGYGMSESPDVPDNIAIYAKDALAVMDQLNLDKAIIGGHSMGGPVTLEMYKTAPDRFAGMILIDTIAAPATAIEAGLWNGFATYAEQNGIDMMYVNALMKNMLTGKTRVNDPAQVNYLTAVIKQASKNGAIGGAKALATRPDYTQTLSQIQVPTLVFVGVDDQIYPVMISQMMQQAIPGAQLLTIPGTAHAAIFEAPDESANGILTWASAIA
jgi:pimeloyl-ACP methyl ester carboxylesterase